MICIGVLVFGFLESAVCGQGVFLGGLCCLEDFGLGFVSFRVGFTSLTMESRAEAITLHEMFYASHW